MKFSSTQTDSEASISSPNIPDIYWTGPVFVVNLSSFLLFFGGYLYILFHNYQNLGSNRTKILQRRENYPVFYPICFLDPRQTVPRIKQNTALWPQFFFGCTVQSGFPWWFEASPLSLFWIRHECFNYGTGLLLVLKSWKNFNFLDCSRI